MIRFFARHPTAANLLMLLFIVAGVASLPSLRRETFPDFTSYKIEVRVVYPGASAEDVEEAICQRIEDGLDGVKNVLEVISEAREGIGTVTIEMIESGDFPTLLADVKTEVDAIDDFPALAEDPVVTQLGLEDLVISVAVTGNMAVTDLKTYCEDLKRRLRRTDNVSLVEVTGFAERQIRIEIPARNLQRYGLSVVDVAHIIEQQNIDLPAGTLEGGDRDILIRFTEQRRTPREYAELVVIGGATGAEIRLGDIASIEDVFEREEDQVRVDGKRAGLLEIKKTKAEDALTAVDSVRAFFAEEESRKPAGVEFIETQDVTTIVRDRLQMLLWNGLQGLVLVLVTMWAFFNWRLSLWVTVGLPVSFLGAFFFLPLLGMTINMLSMVALLLALGLLMDDAIVIAENVAARLKGAATSETAAIEGTLQVRNGVLSSFATTTCVFVPLAFVAGDMGKVLRVMPIVLIAVLAVSLVEAFWVLPRHLSHSLAHYDPEHIPPLRRRFNSATEWVRERVVGAGADLAVSWRYLFLGLVGGIFLFSVGWFASGRLQFVAFPDIDGDVVQARVLLPQGTPFAYTEEVCARLERALLAVNEEYKPHQPDGQDLVSGYTTIFNVNADAKESGPHVATVAADLLKAENRNARIDDIISSWRREMGDVPGVISLQFKEPAIGPAGLPIDVRLQGDDLDALKSASLELQDWFRQFDGVFDVTDDLRPGKPELRVRLREGAVALGMTARTIADQLRSSFYGSTASEIQVGTESYEIDVRLAASDRETITDVGYFQVTLPDGRQAPLFSFAYAEESRGWARIARVDGIRTVTVQGDVDTRVANSAQIMQRLDSEWLPILQEKHPQVSLSLEGQAKETAATQSSLGSGMLLGLIGIFFLLSFQFRSYVEPLIVLAAIPLCLIGVIWGHMLMGLPLTIPSMFGFVSLAGIVVNDSILLVEFIKMHRRSGMAATEACPRASRDRFRAVLLTSLTTIAGLTPLLLEKSLQAQFLIPLAASIVFGMLTSTLLILFVIPAAYTVFVDLGLAQQDGATRRSE